MNISPSVSPFGRLLAALTILPFATAGAVMIDKANNADILVSDTSWVGGIAPTAADVARWTSTVTGANSVSMGIDLSWLGLAIVGPGGPVTIEGGNTLTLAASGIDMSVATQNLTINSNLTASAAQSWNVAAGRSLTTNGGVDLGTFTLTVTGSGDTTINGAIAGSGLLAKTGNGTLFLTTANSYTGGTNLGAANGEGVVRVSASGALGSGTILFDASGGGAPGGPTSRLELVGDITLTNAITLSQRNNSSAIIRNISGNNFLTGAINVFAGGTQARVQSDSGFLTISGPITTASTSARTFYMQGAGDGAVTNVISNNAGNAAGVMNVAKEGLGTWTLSGASTYTGTTTVNGGVLQLGDGASGSISASSALRLGGGTFRLLGGPGTTAQTVAGVTFVAGHSAIMADNGSGTGTTLNLGAITRNVGATGNFIQGTGAVTTTTVNTNGILPGLTVDGNTWAVGSAAGVATAITPFASYLSTSGLGTSAAGYVNANVDVDSSPGLLDGVIGANSLRFNTAAPTTVTLAEGINTLAAGSILVTSDVGSNLSTISGGTLEGAASRDLVIIQNNTQGALTINSIIANNTAATGLTKSGAGVLNLTGVNTYTGATAVNAGTVNYSGTLATGAGAITVGNSAASNARLNITSSGTVQGLTLGVGTNATAAGAVYQSSGAVVMTKAANADNFVLGAANDSYGYYKLSGGTITANEIGVGGLFSASTGVMDITGGSVTDSGYLVIGRGGTTSSGLVNVTGGTFTAARIEMDWASATGSLSVLNVGGGVGAAAVSTTGSATLGLNLAVGNVAGTTSVANLLTNGTLTTGIVTAAGGANPTALLNFNGGKLVATATNAGAAFMTNANGKVFVYGNGGTIDNSGTAITIAKPLLAPTGNGISSIAITGGTGYVGAPLVNISGGGGTGATGYATLDSNGNITGIVMTNAGTGYTSTPTVSLIGGGGNGGVIGTVSTAANVSGGMTFAGAGTTTLTGISTYTGNTIVNNGTLNLADNGGLKFAIGANGVNTTITGTSGTLTLNGDFTFDLSGASTAPGSSWTIVDKTNLNVTFSSTFSVVGFTEASDVWTLGNYQFSEATGVLSVAPVPEPQTIALFLGALGLVAFRERKRIQRAFQGA